MTQSGTGHPGPDTMIQSALDRRNLRALFAALPLLRDLDADLLDGITREIEWFSLPGGTTLFSAGQPVDGLYVVVNGALGVYSVRPGGGSQLTGRVPAGETVGETDVITGRNRSVTVVALHDSEVARLSVSTFEKLVASHPQSLRHVVNVVTSRLEALQHGSTQPRVAPKALVVVPNGSDVDAARFASTLAQCLRQMGRTEIVLSSLANDQTSHWFHRLERANDFVVYVSDPQPTNWSKLCLRRADIALLLARNESPPRAWRVFEANHDLEAAGRPVEIVLLSDGSRCTQTSRRWVTLHSSRRHHHVRGPADIARVARLVTGRALAVVLSGGGARGFAHIGVMRALQAASLPVDAIGATSIGAIIGAGWAAGWTYAEMKERVHRSFVDTNPLGDYTLPFVSLVAGRRVNHLLRAEFGEAHIEDLQLPYFCVSANLTNGQAAVHRRGALWLWLRASVAIPGVLPPLFAQRQVHVDGATINNLPVDIMRDSLDAAIIAVDVGADRTFETNAEMSEVPPIWRLLPWLRRERPRVNILQILLRSGMINSAASTIAQRELADLVLKPPLERIDLLDWRAFDRAIELGYRYASEVLDEHGAALVRSLNSRGVVSRPTTQPG
jgi:NTE family protein